MKKIYTKKQIKEAINTFSRMLMEKRMSEAERLDMINKFQSGIVEFGFIKYETDAAGERTGNMIHRDARGTQNMAIIPAKFQQELQQALQARDPRGQLRSTYMIPYFDLDKGAIRQFHISRFEGISGYTQTDSKIEVQKLTGNKFLYTNQEIEDDKYDGSVESLDVHDIEGIDSEIRSLFGASGGISSGMTGSTVDVEFDVVDSVPTLYYRVNIKSRKDSFTDQIPFKVQEIRKHIFDEYKVTIQKVEVEMNIDFE